MEGLKKPDRTAESKETEEHVDTYITVSKQQGWNQCKFTGKKITCGDHIVRCDILLEIVVDKIWCKGVIIREFIRGPRPAKNYRDRPL